MLRTTLTAVVATAALFGFQAARGEPAHAAAPKIETAPVDYDSLGLFQQRPSAGWGSVEQIIDPAHAKDAATIVGGIWS